MNRSVLAPIATLLAIPTMAVSLSAPVSATPAARPPATPAVSVVHPGHSIQAAIDSAATGATIMIAAGQYAESLTVTKPITLVGRGSVVIVPPTTAPHNACTLDPDANGRVPGMCVVGRLADPSGESAPIAAPVTGVHISGLRLRGFTAAAVEIYGARHVTLDRVHAVGNAGGGVFVAKSADVRVSRLTAADNGSRGVDIHQQVTGFTITHSRLIGNRGEGVFVGDSRDGLIAHNKVSGNCTGILLIDLALPGDTGARRIRVTHNDVKANNAYCAADSAGQPAESGNGIMLVGARHSTVTRNRVRGNAPSRSVDVSFGGIALLDAGHLTGGAAPRGNIVTRNIITGNSPMDLLYDGSGTDNTVRRNVCAASVPSGACTVGH